MSLTTPSDKRRKNPFKPPSPLLKRQQQKPLNFFLGRSKSTLEQPQQPLVDLTGPIVNLASSQPLAPKNLQESTTAIRLPFAQFDEEDHEEPAEIVPQIKNFKNSKPLAERIQKARPFRPLVTLGTLDRHGQQMLSFGGKTLAPTKKPLNPWDQGSRLRTKNPRVETKRPVTNKMIARANPAMVLSDEQKQVIELVVKGGQNVFYTGSAGTGKSVLLREIVAGLRGRYGDKSIAVTASTGLAAVNIGGSTINRLSGMGIGDRDPHAYISSIQRKPELKERWRKMKVLIIDEISMLDGQFLDKLDRVARGVRLLDLPFGGVQMVLTGDFFQLPPVPDRSKPVKFCFEANSWKYIDKTILLHKVFRQADPEFVEILNAVRMANVSDKVAQSLSKLCRPVQYEEGIQPTELYSTRNEVENSNRRRLAALPGEVKRIRAQDVSQYPQDERLLDNTMAAKELELKIGAQVMMLKNMDDTLVNGSLGIVHGFLRSEQMSLLRVAFPTTGDLSSGNYDALDSREGLAILKLISDCNAIGKITEAAESMLLTMGERQKKPMSEVLSHCEAATDGNTYPVVRFKMPRGCRIAIVTREEFPLGGASGDEKASSFRSQVPLLLAWALSIHKAQGQTLAHVKVDLNKVFEAGQVYVALSRAVSKENLQIVNFDPSKIRVNKSVKTFYESLERL